LLTDRWLGDVQRVGDLALAQHPDRRRRRRALLREVTLDPSKRYQPIPRPDTSHWKRGTAEPNRRGFGRPRCPETSHGGAATL
jgi:hypothetical protein